MIEEGIKRIDDDCVEVNKESSAFKTKKILLPQGRFSPFTRNVFRMRDSEFGKRKVLNVLMKARRVVSEADELVFEAKVPGDHRAKSIDVLRAIKSAPFHAENIAIH